MNLSASDADTQDFHERYERQRSRLQAAGQDHVLRFWGEMSSEEQHTLLQQLEEIDLDQLRALSSGELTVCETSKSETRRPAPVIRLGQQPKGTTRQEAVERGEDLLRQGKVGIFLVAGGQGSRLGFEGPKGCLPAGPLSGRTLFELHAAKIRRLSEKHHAEIPWYIMTSEQNDEPTQEFFRRHEFFGLPPESVLFLPQAMLPALDDSGHMILESKSRIFRSPNGHGGTFEAFSARGGLEHAEQRGLDHVFYFQVDNVLIRMADPLFMGYHDLADAEMSLKVIEKVDASEKIGIVVLEENIPRIIEYSDLSSEEAARRDESGRLVFWAGNPAIHAFSLDFMRRAATGDVKLPYHVARKEIPSVDEEGRPSKITGSKYETFVFDALPATRRFVNLEIAREQEFAPIKNRTGTDSLETAHELLMEEHRRWLREIGIEARGQVEISPLAGSGPQDLEGPLADSKGRSFDRAIRVEKTASGQVRIEEAG